MWKNSKTGGGAALLTTDSKGLSLRHDNTLSIGENIPEVGEEKSKGFGVWCHPELVSGSHAGIPKQVRNDKMRYPIPLREGEVVREERVTTSGEGIKEMLNHLPATPTDAGSHNSYLVGSLCRVQHDKEYSLALRERVRERGQFSNKEIPERVWDDEYSYANKIKHDIVPLALRDDNLVSKAHINELNDLADLRTDGAKRVRIASRFRRQKLMLHRRNSVSVEQIQDTSYRLNDFRKKAAFTLAEVLITLGIIGVVAAMTIPTLIANYQEKATVSKAKQAYSLVAQAYQLAKVENGELSQWGFAGDSSYSQDENGNNVISDESAESMKIFWQKMGKHLKVASTCYYDDNACQVNLENMKTLDGRDRNIDSAKYSSVTLSNGMTLFGGWINNVTCSSNSNESLYCLDFGVDINGLAQAPNTVGKDIYYFLVFRDKIVPYGETYFPDRCIFDGPGLSANNNGYACSWWIINIGNMEYLKCNDLEINGKHKCNE